MDNNVKKKIGSNAYIFLKRNFNNDFLSENLPKVFGQLSDIRYIQEQDLSTLKLLLNSLSLEKKQVQPSTSKTAKELLDEAGYYLDDTINNRQDYMKYIKYFTKKEQLCKFCQYDATERYSKLFFIISKNIDNINRSDYPNPDRQDKYSTSCMSLGINKNKKNISQITSRYNHTVSGCDNTFNSNLDNIVKGLTKAFNKDYQLNINNINSDYEFKNFYSYNKKYFYYKKEINGIKIGINTIDGVIYNADHYLTFDYFLLDLKTKKIKSIKFPKKERDYLLDLVNNFDQKIKITKLEERKKLIKFSNFFIILDKANEIIEFNSNLITEIGNYFLYYNKNLTKISLPKVEEIENCFLYYNENLTKISLPKVEKIGNYFLYYNKNLTKISLPKVEKIGDCFLNYNENLTKISLPKVEEIGNCFLYYNKNLTKISLPKVEKIGNCFLRYNKNNLTK